jgi:hypothetical protein
MHDQNLRARPVALAKAQQLREQGILAENENALYIGDHLFAENFVTGERRLILDQTLESVSETRQLLRD